MISKVVPERDPQLVVRRDFLISPGFLLGLCLIFTAICFLPCLQNGITNWDDNQFLTENPLVRHFSWQNSWAIFFSPYCSLRYLSPVVVLIFSIEYHFFGMNPFIYHLTNVLLHLVNTGLVFFFFLWLCGRLRVAFLVALFFGIHPMHVESVAWISELKDMLCAFFFLWSLMVYGRYRDGGKRVLYLACLLLYLLASTVKPLALVLPLVLLLIDLYRKRPLDRAAWIEKIPFIALGIYYSIPGLLSQYLFLLHLRGAGAIVRWDHFFYACYAFLFYIGKLLFPLRLSCVYPTLINADGHLPVFMLMSPALLLMLAAMFIRFAKFSRKILFGGLFYFVMTIPVIEVIPVNSSIVFDRYTYLSSLGIFYLLAELYEKGSRHPSAVQKPLRTVLPAVAVVLAVTCGMMTFARCYVWRNDKSLWADVVRNYPRMPMGHLHCGNVLSLSGEFDAAIRAYNEALRLKPRYKEAYYNRGLTYFKQGNYAQAIYDFNRVLFLEPQHEKAKDNLSRACRLYDETISRDIAENPEDTKLIYNRATFYAEQKHYREAINDYNRVLQLDPNCVQAYVNRGSVYQEQGRYDEALKDYQQCLRLNPKQAEAFYNQAMVLERMNRPQEAKAAYASFLTCLDPSLQNTPYAVKARQKAGH